MRIFGSDRLDKMLSTLGLQEGEAIVHPWVNKSLERAQAKVEGRNFDIRKQLLKFDDVMNDQRKAIFGQRLEIMGAEDINEITQDMRHQVIDDLVEQYMPPRSYADQWDTDGLHEALKTALALDLPVQDWADEEGVDDEAIRERIARASDEYMAKKAVDFGPENMRQIEKQVLLQTIDAKWREHLLTLEHLRSVVGFRGYAQRDPLNEYKTEGFQLFEAMLDSLRADVTEKLSRIQPLSPEQQQEIMRQMQDQQKAAQDAADQATAAAERAVDPAAVAGPTQRPALTRTILRHGATPGGTIPALAGRARSSSIATGVSNRLSRTACGPDSPAFPQRLPIIARFGGHFSGEP